MKDVDSNERFIKLEWEGPFSYSIDGLGTSIIDAYGPNVKKLEEYLGKPGLYLIIGDHPIHGARSLLYIGITNKFERRLKEHSTWLKKEWRVEVYLAIVKDIGICEDAEKLLITAHGPAYNFKHLNSHGIEQPLRLWNIGRFWKLHPELSSDHPWFPQ